MGRTQGGNNNAYCQDTPVSWVNWRSAGEWADQTELTATLPEDISYLEMLKTEVDRRYASPLWYAGIAGDNGDAVLRELAYMQALSLNLSYLQLRQGERIEGLLARLNVGDARREREALQEERAAALNLQKASTRGTGSTGTTAAPAPEPPAPPTSPP